MSRHERNTYLAMAWVALQRPELNLIEISRLAWRLVTTISTERFNTYSMRCDLRMAALELDTYHVINLTRDEELMS